MTSEKTVLSLGKINEATYLKPEELDELTKGTNKGTPKKEPKSKSFDLDRIVSNVSLIEQQHQPPIVVTLNPFGEDYLIIEGKEVVSAYAYLGKTEIPVTIHHETKSPTREGY